MVKSALSRVAKSALPVAKAAHKENGNANDGPKKTDAASDAVWGTD